MSATGWEVASVAGRMRAERAVAVAVHEHPDLDALGSAIGVLDVFRQIGVSAQLHIDDPSALPQVSFGLSADDISTAPAPAGCVLYALDAGSASRLALPGDGLPAGVTVVNIDHHHDNTRYGTVNLVLPNASSVSEIVCLLAEELALRLSVRAATALYAGISFDTGHFRHASTGPATFRAAARLVEWGADPHTIYAELYERRGLADLRLLAAAVRSVREALGGRVLVAVLTADDFAHLGAADGTAEGIVESLNSLRGVEVAALIKEQEQGPRCRVSMRSGGWDVSRFAAEQGGGGHRQAAGFSIDRPPEEVAEWLSSVLARRLSTASS